MTSPEPDFLMICVAPNGARKVKADHPAIPLSVDEMAEGAVRWRDAGACMLHLHVRDENGGHILDAGLYRQSTEAVRRAVGDDLIIQITTEAVGHYKPDEQMAVVRAVEPEAVSLAVRELIPAADQEPAARSFLRELHDRGCLIQYILYSSDDVDRLRDLVRRGVIPGNRVAVLFVLGRYTRNQESDPRDVLPFVERWDMDRDGLWSVCAFGRREAACVLTAAGFGGHARVGFENNLHKADGSLAADNADLVAQVAQGGRLMGRRPATAAQARAMLRACR